MSRSPRILTIPSRLVSGWEGVNVWSGYGHSIIESPELRFVEREPAETDLSLKQLVVYAVVKNSEGQVLVYTRGKSGGEDRLHDLLSVGVGGHIDEPDIDHTHSLYRELDEELGVKDFTTGLIGILNSEESDVDRVHVGLLFVVTLDEGVDITAEDCIKDFHWVESRDLEKLIPQMERWSQIATECLLDINLI